MIKSAFAFKIFLGYCLLCFNVNGGMSLRKKHNKPPKIIVSEVDSIMMSKYLEKKKKSKTKNNGDVIVQMVCTRKDKSRSFQYHCQPFSVKRPEKK
jgi:hypothetical protein